MCIFRCSFTHDLCRFKVLSIRDPLGGFLDLLGAKASGSAILSCKEGVENMALLTVTAKLMATALEPQVKFYQSLLWLI